MDLIKIAEQALATEQKNFPAFKAGDTITVQNKKELEAAILNEKLQNIVKTFSNKL